MVAEIDVGLTAAAGLRRQIRVDRRLPRHADAEVALNIGIGIGQRRALAAEVDGIGVEPEALGDGHLPIASIGHEIRDGTDIAGDAGPGIELGIQPDMPADGELRAAGIERPECESEGVTDVRGRELGIDGDVAGRQVVAGGGHEVSPRDGRAAMGRIRRIRADMHGTVQVQIARAGQDMGIRPGTTAAQAADAVVAMRRAGPRHLRVRQHRDAAQIHATVLGVDVKARRAEALVELHDMGDVGEFRVPSDMPLPVRSPVRAILPPTVMPLLACRSA